MRPDVDKTRFALQIANFFVCPPSLCLFPSCFICFYLCLMIFCGCALPIYTHTHWWDPWIEKFSCIREQFPSFQRMVNDFCFNGDIPAHMAPYKLVCIARLNTHIYHHTTIITTITATQKSNCTCSRLKSNSSQPLSRHRISPFS